MSFFGKTFGLLLGLALIAALGAAAYLALEFIVSLFAGLDTQVARVTAIASVVVLLASMIITAGIREAGRRSTAVQHREQKAATYQFFVDCWEDPTSAREKLQALDRLLALYGAAAVIKAHVALRTIAREKGSWHPDAASQFGKALFEIRKDLGEDGQGITAGELQELVLPVSDSVGSAARLGDPQPSAALASRS
jgi:hypothetical protein